MLTIDGIPGLYALEAWVVIIEDAELEIIENSSNTTPPIGGNNPSRNNMKLTSNAPTGHKRGR